MEAAWLSAAVVVPLCYNLHSAEVFDFNKTQVVRFLALIAGVAWILKGAVSTSSLRDKGRRAGMGFRRLAASPLSVPVLVFVAAYGMMRLLGWWERPRLETPASPLATRTVPIEPRLQVEAPKELKALQRAEQEILTSYAWVSKEAGIARIPVDRAMRFVLERGLPTPKPAASATPPVKGDAR